MITNAQAAQYLDQALGISLPAFVIDAAIAKVQEAEPAMVSAGYSAPDQTLIQCIAVALIAAAGSPRRIHSQGAASGASRSFKSVDGDLTSLRISLAAIDTAKTVSDLVGPDPRSPTMFMVV